MSAEGIAVITSLPTWAKTGIAAALGFLLRHFWDVARGRRITISWAVTYQKVTPRQGPAAPKISVLWKGIPCTNLQICSVEICNESGRDMADFDLLFTFTEPFTIIESQGNVATSAKILFWSNSYKDLHAQLTALQENERNNHPSFAYLRRNTEFHLLALNHGDKATFKFWIHSPNATDVTNLNVTMEKAGVRLIQRPTMFRTWEVFRIKTALKWGLPISMAAIVLLTYASLPPGLLASLCFVIGLAAAGIGMLATYCVKILKRLV